MERIKNWGILGAVFLLITIMPCLPSSAGAAFYKYIDRNGIVHFTDRYESIPQEYRDQVKTLREETKPPSPAPPSAGQEKKKESEQAAGEQAGKAQETTLKEAEAIEARKKEAEDRKLKAFEEKEKRIEELQKQIGDKQKQQKSLRTNWMVQDRNIIIRLNEEIAVLEKQIKSLQSELGEER